MEQGDYWVHVAYSMHASFTTQRKGAQSSCTVAGGGMLC